MKSIEQKLRELGGKKGAPAVSISLNTHRTHPDNGQDKVVLKNLLKEAEEKVIEEYGKRPAAALLERLASVDGQIDINYNLDSLHLFLSNDTEEIIRDIWPVAQNTLTIGEEFAVVPLIRAVKRLQEYFILVVSKGGVKLYEAVNDKVTGEVSNEHFPVAATQHYTTHSDKASDAGHVDNLSREYLNKVDKGFVQTQKDTGTACIVFCTEDNFSQLMQVADIPSLYSAHIEIDYNQLAPHELGLKAWEAVQQLQEQTRVAALAEMQGAVSTGSVSTDLQEIWQASIDGRGELLIVNPDYAPTVFPTGDRTFDITNDVEGSLSGTDDIVDKIAWNVFSQGGRIVFTDIASAGDFGSIALKVRY